MIPFVVLTIFLFFYFLPEYLHSFILFVPMPNLFHSALHALPVALLLVFPGTKYIQNFIMGSLYEVVNPRHKFSDILVEVEKKKGLSAADMLGRARAAHENTFEAFCMFGIASLAATLKNVPDSLCGQISSVFVVSRVLYILVYVFAPKLQQKFMLRSLLFVVGQLAIMDLMLLAIKPNS